MRIVNLKPKTYVNIVARPNALKRKAYIKMSNLSGREEVQGGGQGGCRP